MINLPSEAMHPFIILSHANSSQVYNDICSEVQLLWWNDYIHQLLWQNKKITSNRISSNYKKGCDKYIFIFIMVVDFIKWPNLIWTRYMKASDFYRRSNTTDSAENRYFTRERTESVVCWIIWMILLWDLWNRFVVAIYQEPWTCLDGGVNGVNGANLPLIYP
jgi:hypothetical protein